MDLHLGKLPARPDAVKLKFSNYVNTAKLPPLPTEFGHERLVADWKMLANNTCGDCVVAGGLHEHLLWNREAGRTVQLNDAAAIANYSQITGYDPTQTDPITGENLTDNGTDMAFAASYRRRVGLVDANGKRHKIGAYVALQPGNLTELWYATYLFDGVGIGVKFPQQWMDAFRAGQPWDRVDSPNIVGGPYITCVAKRGGNADVITWGAVQRLTGAGYQQFNDETFAYASREKLLVRGKDLEGLNWPQLLTDLTAVAHA